MKKLLIIVLLSVGCEKEPIEREICGLKRIPEHPGGATAYYCYSDVSEAKCDSKAESDSHSVDFYGGSQTCVEYCESKSSCYEM